MILTLTLNPAIDKTLLIENFSVNQVNRILGQRIDAGGKGINVSKVVQFFKEETISLGIVGGHTGNELIALLENIKIPYDFVKISGDTRINTKVVDPINNTCTDINAAGPHVNHKELMELKEKLQYYGKNSQFIVLSGNVQSGIPDNFYREIIEENTTLQTKILLDAGGIQLSEAIKASPWLVKPNVDELRELTGKTLETQESIIEEGRYLSKQGIKYVCISMGYEGLLLITSNEVWHAKPPKITPKSTVGAGDSVVGSLAVSFIRKESNENALKMACAMSAACVTLEGTAIPEKTQVNDLYKEVVISRLS